MKRLILALILLASTIAFIGCGEQSAQISITSIDSTTTGYFVIYSPKVKVENVGGGSIIQAPRLFMENGYDYDITVDVYFERPSKETIDIDTGLTYQPAPEGFEKWLNDIKLTDYKIPAYTSVSLPVTITLPKNIQVPERWEFDIKVCEPGGFVSTALIQRWLITMEN